MIIKVLALAVIGLYLKKKEEQEGKREKESESQSNTALAKTASNARDQQLAEIVFGGSEVEESANEMEAKRNFRIATLTLAAASGGLFWKPLLVASLAGMAYLVKPIFDEALEVLKEEERLSINAVHLVVIAGVLLRRHIFTAVLTAWFVILTRWLIVKTEDQSRKRLVSLFVRTPPEVWVLTESGVEVPVPFEEVQQGDTVVVSAGEVIPVDGTVMEGQALVDQHMLTGESQPTEKHPGDPVFNATIVLEGRVQVHVDRAGAETVAAQIVAVLNRTADYREELQTESQVYVDSLAAPMLAGGAIAYPLVGAEAALGILWNVPGVRMEYFGPLTMLSYLHRASDDGILIKDGRALESLGTLDTVVFDKTGTLTLDQEVGQVYAWGDLSEDKILGFAASAEHRQRHPIAQAIRTAAQERDLSLEDVEPGEYDVGLGVSARVAGQLIRVGSRRFLEREGLSLTAEVEELQARCHEQGSSLVLVGVGEEVAGAIELCANIRPETHRIIEELKERRLSLHILSGDHEAPTRHLAERLGIDSYWANNLPADKAEWIQALQQEGHKVCFVGDGINDSLALQHADVSVSLRGATTVATDTAQIVLMDETLDQLAHLFEIGDRFKAQMTTSFQIATLPSALIIGGNFLFRWSFVTSAVLGLLPLFGGLAYILANHKVTRRNLLSPGGDKESAADEISSGWAAEASQDSARARREYDQLANDYDELVRDWHYDGPTRAVRLAADFLDPSARILDVGCGTGLVGEQLRQSGFEDLTGVDISAKSLELAQDRNDYRALYTVDLKRRLPFNPAVFDAAFCIGVLTYLPELPLLAELRRVVKRGGFLVFSHRHDLWQERDLQSRFREMAHQEFWEECLVTEPCPYLPNHESYGDRILVRYFIYRNLEVCQGGRS